MKRQHQFCHRVLDLYVAVSKTLGIAFTSLTWSHLLRLLMAICDNLLRPEEGREPLADQSLTVHATQVLFELWMRSETRDSSLWEQLRTLCANWRSKIIAIQQWIGAVRALNQRIISLLFGPTEGSPSITLVRTEGSSVNLDLQDEYIYYCWYRMLHVFGNPNTLEPPHIYLAAANGIKVFCTSFLRIGETSKGSVVPPNGNTVLEIFGDWLFEALQANRTGFEEGTSIVIETLATIFTTRFDTPFNSVYLTSFYSSLIEVLSGEGQVVIASLLGCQSLLFYELPGVRILIPYFVRACKTYLLMTKDEYEKSLTGHIPKLDRVRSACLKILGSILCLGSRLAGATFSSLKALIPETKLHLYISTYEDLETQLKEILLRSVQTEFIAINLNKILSLMAVFITQYLPRNPQRVSPYAASVIDVIISRVLSNKHLPADTFYLAFKTLVSIGRHHRHIEKYPTIAGNVIRRLAELIIKNINEPHDNDPVLSEHLIVGAFETLLHWTLSTDVLLTESVTMNALLNALVLALGEGDVKHLPPSVTFAADQALLQLLQWVGVEGGATEVGPQSSSISEAQILSHLDDEKQYIRYFATPTTIFSIIDIPKPALSPSTIVISRTRYGKHAWRILQQTDIPARPEPWSEIRQRVWTQPVIVPTPETVEEEELVSLLSYLSTQGQADAQFQQSTEKSVNSEQAALQASSYGLNVSIAVQPARAQPPYENAPTKMQASRLLLAKLGWVSPDSRRLVQVEGSKSFLESLQRLDLAHERECHKVGVIYVKAEQRQEAEIYQNDEGSPSFQTFLKNLGWGITPGSPSDFTGGLHAKDGLIAPYFADHQREVIFHVSTLIESPARAKQLIDDAPVVVVWSEDHFVHFQPTAIGSSQNILFIVINPTEGGLYRIKIVPRDGNGRLLGTNERHHIGPLIDQTLVTETVLAHLVRETAINASDFISRRKGTMRPYEMRSTLIQEIVRLYKREGSMNQFYGNLFSPVSSLSLENVLPPTITGQLRPTSLIPGSLTEKQDTLKAQPDRSRTMPVSPTAAATPVKKTPAVPPGNMQPQPPTSKVTPQAASDPRGSRSIARSHSSSEKAPSSPPLSAKHNPAQAATAPAGPASASAKDEKKAKKDKKKEDKEKRKLFKKEKRAKT